METRVKSTMLEQLIQIAETPIWDGDLISKDATARLSNKYLVCKAHGFNIITAKGIEYLSDLDLIVR